MKSKHILIFLVISFICLNIVLYSFATMYAIKDQDGKIICITNQHILNLELKEKGYTIIYLCGESSPKEIGSPPESSELPKSSKSLPVADIEIIDWTNRLSKTGNYYYVEGTLENISNNIATKVRVKIQALDKNEKLISLEEGYSDPSTLKPSQKGFFSVMVDYNSKIEYFSLTVLWK